MCNLVLLGPTGYINIEAVVSSEGVMGTGVIVSSSVFVILSSRLM